MQTESFLVWVVLINAEGSDRNRAEGTWCGRFGQDRRQDIIKLAIEQRLRQPAPPLLVATQSW